MHKRLLREAQECAPLIFTQENNVAVQTGVSLDPVHERDDDQPFVIGESKSRPDRIKVAHLGDVMQLDKAGAELGFWKPMSNAELVNYWRHEAQHAVTARRLGASILEFTFGLWNVVNPDGRQWVGRDIAVATPSFTTTRLGYALIAANPEIPSPGDERRYKDAGYTMTELVQKATKRGMPMPRSVRP